MPMYNSIEYNDAYLKTLGSSQQYHRDEPSLKANGEIVDFPADENNSVSFKFKQQIKGETENNSEKKFKAMVPLSYLSTFWRTPEMPLIDCEISLQLKQSKNCIFVAGTVENQNPSFQTNNVKLYVPVLTLSIQENIKLLKELLT